MADGEQEQRGDGVADRVGDDRQVRAEQLDQAAAEAGPRHLGRGAYGLQRAVARDELVLGQELRQIALVGDVEEDRGDAGDQRDGIELSHRQEARYGGEGDAGHRHGPDDVGPDQHRELAHPVHPGAGGQADEEERGGLRRRQQGHLEGGRVEFEYGDQRQGDKGHLRADLARRRAGQQMPEVPVPKQTARRGLVRGAHLPDI